MTNQCEFCKKKFVKASTLYVHVCEQKRRFLAKSEKHVILAYDTFKRFHTLNNTAGNQEKTYQEFMQSPYYNAFIKFGSFVNNVKPLYPDNFIKYIITSGIKLDDWCKDSVYDNYVLALIQNEPVEVALERGVMHMVEWAEKNNTDWNLYFKAINKNKAVYDIKDGKISPWFVLNSQNGKNLLNTFEDSQLTIIGRILNIPFWLEKFKKQQNDVMLVKKIIKESNL